jgi:hypothetical protein
VRLSALYGKPVRLFDLGIRNCSFGRPIDKTQFEKIKESAGEIREYRP